MDLIEEYGKPLALLIVTAILGVGGREWIVRARSGTRRMTAEDGAQVSVLDGALQREVALLERIDILTAERDELKADLGHAEAKMMVMQMLASGNEAGAIQFAKDSGFADIHRPLRPRPPPSRPSSHDLFQAADPYSPPPSRKPPR